MSRRNSGANSDADRGRPTARSRRVDEAAYGGDADGPCASSRRQLGQRAGWRARNRGDSGSIQRSTTAATIGTTPPRMNSVRQPTSGSARMPSRPASVPPSGTQTIVDGDGDRAAGAPARIRPPAPPHSASRRPGRCPPATAARPASSCCRPAPRPASSRRTRPCCRAAPCGGPNRSPARPAAAPPIIMPT